LIFQVEADSCNFTIYLKETSTMRCLSTTPSPNSKAGVVVPQEFQDGFIEKVRGDAVHKIPTLGYNYPSGDIVLALSHDGVHLGLKL
jgi:hypothetical protein